jgi:adenylate cyclase
MSSKFRQLSPHAVIIFGVFILFLLSATGLLDFTATLSQGVLVNSHPLPDVNHATPKIVGADFVCFISIGLILSVMLPRFNPVNASILTFLAMLPPFAVEYMSPGVAQRIPMELTLLMTLVLFSVNVLLKYFLETHERQKIISVFGQYVPPAVVDAISQSPEKFSLEGEARELTVLFCDIRNFSGISEGLDPRQLAKMLNVYFTELTDVLHSHGATIDKYMGDAIMAFWGAPLAQPDHPTRAVNAGVALLDALGGINTTFTERGWPTIDIGVGINTGVMNVGNMGSRYRIAYTVVGDAVNLGARLEGLTRIYDTRLIVSETTVTANSDYEFRELDHVRVKGKGQATRIFEPVGRRANLSAEQKSQIAEHRQAIEAYYCANWRMAERLFADLDTHHGGSRYYVVMRNRILALSAKNDQSFDGITSFNAQLSVG